jgi:ribosomal protein S1
MKITLLTSALAAIVGFAFIGAPVTASAQTATNATAAAAPSTAPKTKEKKKSDKTQYEGSITAIDASSLTVATSKKTLTLAITPKTTFKKDKAAATAADFAVGDKVTGSYSTDSTGALSAASVHKKSAAAPAAAAAPAQK